MVKITQLERFYETHFSKALLARAINNLNFKDDFETKLKARLSIRDFVFTYLSYLTSWNVFLYIWKNYFTHPDTHFILNRAYEVIQDKYSKKSELVYAIRCHLAKQREVK